MLQPTSMLLQRKVVMTKIAVLAVLLVGSSALPATQPGSAQLDTLLRTAVEQKRVPMAVAMVADVQGVVYEQAVGAPQDAIFAIASMTKPITTVAVMHLVEAGRDLPPGARQRPRA
jgi:methyl acetate hydrolase